MINGSAPIHEYALAQMDQLLKTLAQTLQRTAKKSAPDPVHDLRVSIRRFEQGLLLFTPLLPVAEVKEIRRSMKRMMDLTSEVRNRDIALDLLADSGSAKLK